MFRKDIEHYKQHLQQPFANRTLDQMHQSELDPDARHQTLKLKISLVMDKDVAVPKWTMRITHRDQKFKLLKNRSPTRPWPDYLSEIFDQLQRPMLDFD